MEYEKYTDFEKYNDYMCSVNCLFDKIMNERIKLLHCAFNSIDSKKLHDYFCFCFGYFIDNVYERVNIYFRDFERKIYNFYRRKMILEKEEKKQLMYNIFCDDIVNLIFEYM